MAQKIRLQDTLEIFLDKLERVESKFVNNENLLSQIDSRMAEIQSMTVKVDNKPVREVMIAMSSVQQQAAENLKDITSNHIADISRLQKEKGNNQPLLYPLILSCSITACALTFGLTQLKDKQEVNSKLQMETHRNKVFQNFIKEKQLQDTYEIWVHNKDEKR